MTHFYMTLPSNASMKIYPNNTVAKYTTQLPTNIELDGEWEVALTEIMYNNKWGNISGEWLRYYNGRSFSEKMHVPNGVYTQQSLLAKVRELLKEAGDTCGHVKFEQYNFSMDYIEVVNDGSLPLRGFDMSHRLTEILGLQKYHIMKLVESGNESYRIYGDKMKDLLEPSVTSLFVYCDVLEHIPVGDTLAPLLRCVSIEGALGKRIGARYAFPMYIPVQKKVFDSVEINIMTETGDPAPFIDGPSTVTLHFRRARNPYFLSK